MIEYVSKYTEEKILEKIVYLSKNSDELIFISAFITLKGFKSIEEKIDTSKINRIIIGVFTSSAYETFNYINENYPKIALFVFKYNSSTKILNEFIYNPILHAKIYAGYNSNIIEWAYTGSANVTDFALTEKNIESGIFLNKPEKELEKIYDSIEQIKNSENLLDFKKKEIPIVHVNYSIEPKKNILSKKKRPLNNYLNINNVILIIVNDNLKDNHLHNIIGLYSSKIDKLNQLKLDDFVLFYFYENNKLILNKIRTVSSLDIFPLNDIAFYIQNINNQTFKRAEHYNNHFKADTFIVVEKIELNKKAEKILDKLETLLEQKSDALINSHIKLENDSILKRIYIDKNKFGLTETKDFKENFEMNIFHINLKQLLNQNENTFFNSHFKLNMIKTLK
jgi:hypothetical protein